MKKIVVLTSGGDAPGMNAAIRAVVRTGHYYGLAVYGCKFGYQGLVDQQLIPLQPENVANCIQQGGTILKAERCEAFYKQEIRDKCRAFLQAEQIDGLVVIGGNGTFQGASLLAEEGGPAVIGIPGTIDNDIPNTEYTIGFDTARNTALMAIDKIRDTASSHNRNFLVEVMGRKSGFLAVDVGIAGGAEIIIIPEAEISIEKMATNLASHKRLKQSSIIVVAEADQPGRSFQIAKQLEALTHQAFRVCILGHTQRGGTPTTLDRLLASEMGYLAVKSLVEGFSHKMTAMQQNKLLLSAFPKKGGHTRQFTNKQLLEVNEVLCL
jgi:6-phosphofructokinase 1